MDKKEAIEVLKKYQYDTEVREALECLHPELKESEDERIRKAILELVKQSSHILNPMNQKSMIAWLEKQGSQNLANFSKTCKVEQNPAWSKEDEKMLDDAIGAVGAADYYTYDDKQEIENWLKALKDRYTWKPSDEQLKALDDFIYAKYPNIERHEAAVKSLYNDLKGLSKI